MRIKKRSRMGKKRREGDEDEEKEGMREMMIKRSRMKGKEEDKEEGGIRIKRKRIKRRRG